MTVGPGKRRNSCNNTQENMYTQCTCTLCVYVHVYTLHVVMNSTGYRNHKYHCCCLRDTCTSTCVNVHVHAAGSCWNPLPPSLLFLSLSPFLLTNFPSYYSYEGLRLHCSATPPRLVCPRAPQDAHSEEHSQRTRTMCPWGSGGIRKHDHT